MAIGLSPQRAVGCVVMVPVDMQKYADQAVESLERNRARCTPRGAECKLDKKVSFHRTFYVGSDTSSTRS